MTDARTLTIPLTDDEPVACPRCASTSGLHFDEVSIIDPLGDIVPLHAQGGEGLSIVTATIADGAAAGRRHLVVLPHWCSECGARGEIVLRQHSGRTFGQYRDVTTAAGAQQQEATDGSAENVGESASTV